MKCHSLTIPVLTLICLLGSTGWASAQYAPGTPYAQPQVSPYLNLLRGGGTPGFNYSTLTRPQLDFRGGIINLQQQTQLNQQLITGLQGTTAGNQAAVTTGQPFGYMTHLGYFQNQGQFAAVEGGAGGGGVNLPRGAGGAPAPRRGR
jgi:hypothetical protein